MLLDKTCFAEFKNFFFKILGPLLFTTSILSIFFQHFYNLAAASETTSLMYQAMAAILSWFSGIIGTLIMGYGVAKISDSKESITSFFYYYFRDLLIETLRAMGRVSLWFLLGILTLPTIYWGFKFLYRGFRTAICYYFISYVVLFDDDYKQGKKDALMECEKLFKDKLLLTFGLLLLTQSIIFVLELIGVSHNIYTSPFVWIVLFLITMAIESFIFLFFYKYYQERKKICH